MIDDDAIVPDDEIQKVKPPQYNKLFPGKKRAELYCTVFTHLRVHYEAWTFDYFSCYSLFNKLLCNPHNLTVKKTSDDAITPDDKPSDTLLELLENGHKENGHKKDVKEIERKLVFENLSCVKRELVLLSLFWVFWSKK